MEFKTNTIVETLDCLIKELEDIKQSTNKNKKWDNDNHIYLCKSNIYSLDLVLKIPQKEFKQERNGINLKAKPIRETK